MCVANITANKAVFDVDDPSILALEEGGELTERSTPIRPGRTFTLSATFTCKKAGNSTVTAVINLPDAGADGSAQKVSFSFVKECEGLRAGEGAAMSGIDIWLGEKFEHVEEPDPTSTAEGATRTRKVVRLADVVRNGIVQDEWRPVQDESAESTTVRSALADAETRFVTFFVELRRAFHDVEYDPPVVSAYSPGGDVVLHPKVGGSIMESSRLQSARARFIVVEFGSGLPKRTSLAPGADAFFQRKKFTHWKSFRTSIRLSALDERWQGRSGMPSRTTLAVSMWWPTFSPGRGTSSDPVEYSPCEACSSSSSALAAQVLRRLNCRLPEGRSGSLTVTTASPSLTHPSRPQTLPARS